MKKLMSKFGRDDRGAVMIPYALTLSAFLMMLMGVVEIGRAYWIHNNLALAVEETARYAMVNPDSSTAGLVSYAQSVADDADAVYDGFAVTSETISGVGYVQVVGSYVYDPITPLISFAPTLTAKSRVPVS